MKKLASQHGFTMLETTIYIALFSLLMTGIIVTAYELLQGGINNRSSVAVQEEGTFINRKMSWALSGASAIAVPDSKTLTITRPDLGSQSPLEIIEADGQMLISRGGAAPTPLTTSELEVSNTVIAIIPPTSGAPTGVSISYMINGTPFLFKTYLRF